ncbi:helicase associated domain-containing protein [Streptomyces sp. NBC_00841]|uniref:helicase associated domain-containing protein n=1 Tax=Streptomyces sp. NBC_00841 TaxID=2975847 RepID=UPI002DD9F670|nr:helicase associated domain-containing protein [Streptomyces sp. NBC_00841]
MAAVDPDWNPGQLGWTVDWQRHWAGLTTLLAAGGTLDEITPGVTYQGDDIGRWLARQVREWARLNPEQQQHRLDELGVHGPRKPQHEDRGRKRAQHPVQKPASAA